MGSVNVNRSVSDQFYRYKMPRLIAKVEGKGNGIKTVIANMIDIGKALNRPPTYPTKYFGCELGAQTQFDHKNDRFIVNGSHDSQKLQFLLDGFIKKFVLCPECDNPETNLLVHQKKQTISQQCMACGFVFNIDMRHKLTTFILKNPPDQKQVVGSSLTSAKEKKKSVSSSSVATSKRKSDRGKNNGTSSPPQDKGGDSDYDFAPDKNGSECDDDDDDWAVDTSEEAIAKRMEDLTDGAKGITLNEDLEKTQTERLNIFYNFVKSYKETGKLEGADKEIVIEAERLDVKEKGMLVLSELLFDGNMMSQIKTHRILLLRFTNGNRKAQKYLLGGFEQLIKLYHDALLSKVAHLLKALYDVDVLDEEVLIDWAAKPSKKYVSKELRQEIQERAAPFIKWLKEAEEEESEGDDDDDDDEEADEDEEEDDIGGDEGQRIVYPDRGNPAKSEPIKVAAKAKDDEDLDIDAI